MDVAIDNPQEPSTLKIRLKASKTDQMRAGVDIYVGRTYNSLCPVVAMLRYLAVRGFDNGPLFRLEDGTPLSRSGLVERLRGALSRAGVDPTRYSSHSFRIGAATTAAANGVNSSTIQRLGRWRSDCYTRYIRTPQDQLANISQVLALLAQQ